MDIFKIVLLVLAYTLGIATLAVQLVCYTKRIEYKETIFLNIAFLLLIITMTVQGMIIIEDTMFMNIKNSISSILLIILAVSITTNIHKERRSKHKALKNRITFLLGLLVLLLSSSYLLKNDFRSPFIISGTFLFISVSYSMIVILLSKPNVLLRKQDKSEKRTAMFILILMFFNVLFIVFYLKNDFWGHMEMHGGITLSIICIVLCLVKLPNDIKKIKEFNRPPELDSLELNEFNITPREKEVLMLLVQGKTYKEIGETLFISVPTVKSHVTSIYEKLQVRNKLELSNLIKQLE